MKFFWRNIIVKANIKLTLCLFIALLLNSCATRKPQYGKKASLTPLVTDTITDTPAHTLYLIGDAGYATHENSKQLLAIVNEKLIKAGKNTSLLYLGDNIYPLGMPPKEETEKRKEAEASLTVQMDLAKSFEGQTIFIPGNHDWYYGFKGLIEQEDFVKNGLKDKKSYLPGKGCAINDIKLGDNTLLVTIDSQWFIEDWDAYPTINDDCSIKTREDLFTELEGLLNKNQDKAIVLAIHHPLMSNGTHGGQFSAEKQLFPLKYKIPLPVLGTFINVLRKTSGASTQDNQSRIYATLIGRIKTLIQDKDNVVVVSGHDHNLQYIAKDNIYQIISGSGSNEEAARAIRPTDFSYGANGYAILDIYNDGSSKVAYYAVKDKQETKLFETRIHEKHDRVFAAYADNFEPITKASIYTEDMTKKGGTYRFLMGNHYRKYYSTPIEVKVASLDTLHGGLTPGRAGGGHQSKSLRLLDKQGREFVMRGLKKSATRFLQAVAFKTRYIGDSFDETYVEDFLLDFYTTSHPYTPFILDDLAETAGIYHTNPELYYIPKQNALGSNNKDFGDELYMVEERPTSEFKALESFGNADDIEGTDDVLANLQKDKKYSVDEKTYIKARLFDMLIGDWDRHSDQWRWARFNEKGRVLYRPIPRDRDQAFAKYDGALLSILMNIPPLRHMQSFKDDISNVKWFNREPYAQDLALITTSDETVWLEQAKKLQNELTDESIDSAFAKLPIEVQDETSESIKATLKKRREHLADYAKEYHEVLLKTVLITGTDKVERFVITRMPDGQTEVKMYSKSKDGAEVLTLDKMYNKKQTKEIWIYGLDDDDFFEVKGEPDNAITLRLLGGQNHDTYTVENGKKVKIYDFKSKQNTYNTDNKARLLLTDDYETNSYDYEKPQYNIWAGYPSIGYNPDDGVKAGAVVNYTINNFNRRPYSQKHALRANYFFATDGFELGYSGRFMNIASKWNFGLDVWYTSPNFSINYFGYGNETPNFDDDLSMDYNRVKLQVFRVTPMFFKEGRNGSRLELQLPFETIEVDHSPNRYISEIGSIKESLFEHRQFAGVAAKYSFNSYDNKSLPALGLGFYITGMWKTSLDEIKQNFPYLESSLNIVHKITHDDSFIFSTTVKGKVLLNDNYEFYQAATLGGDTDLRGYRRERFTGKQSFYHSSDLRLALANWKTSFLPMKFGVTAGFDYGRVWVDNDSSRKWHKSYGGAVWLNAVDALTARVAYFQGEDGGRISVGFSFGL
ncbi:metallophosphoesterase [Flavobacterium sp. DG1-102-2]|uniref:metallophosphoesterase n=1 Tax=Flavobacterium sp. DG1-102-2 TaxID=3081663 RepID=UPI002949CE11|nr:metallophosphoesterase [Flavobacterium sp. DG1-102-2]MDV6168763.1 metallophosphoesterase [Flavobacterium sp. DG1-102-2]